MLNTQAHIPLSLGSLSFYNFDTSQRVSRYGTVPRFPTAAIDSFPLASFFAKAYERSKRIKQLAEILRKA